MLASGERVLYIFIYIFKSIHPTVECCDCWQPFPNIAWQSVTERSRPACLLILHHTPCDKHHPITQSESAREGIFVLRRVKRINVICPSPTSTLISIHALFPRARNNQLLFRANHRARRADLCASPLYTNRQPLTNFVCFWHCWHSAHLTCPRLCAFDGEYTF